MSVAKVVEISSSSPTSFEDAVKNGIDKAGESLRGIKGAWVSEEKVDVENGVDHRVPRHAARLVRPRVAPASRCRVGPRGVRPSSGDQSISPQDV